MSRLPTPGSDNGQWGTILNDFLSQEHNSDGTLKKAGLIAGAQQESEKGQPGGYAPLGVSGIVPSNHLPAAVTPPDATGSGKGLIQLAGDLGGTAASPTAPALTSKVSSNDVRLTDARVTVEKAGATVGSQRNLNLLEGANITIDAADNPGADMVDVTITAATPAPTISDTLVDAKGDLIVATAADTPDRLTTGTDGQVLTTDSSSPNGVSWATVGASTHTIQKDGAATTQRPTLDFEGGGQITDNISANRTQVFISREYLNVTDPRIGIKMSGGGGGGGDQGAKLQAAIDLAASSPGDACVFIPPGTLTINREIVFPDTKSVRLIGSGNSDFAGSGPSGIFVSSDLGAGKYAFKLSNAVKDYVENIAVSGPGSSSTPYGTMPAQMYGMYCPGPCLVKNVTLGAFGANIGVIGSGQEWRSCSLSGSGYGMDWLDNPTNIPTANQLIERCFFTSNTRAGIAIADSSHMFNVRFKGNGHFGTCPFGIYRYANPNGSTPSSVIMQDVIFENWSFEGCNHATIYDEPGDGLLKNIAFDPPAEASTFAWQPWPGKPTNLASIDVGYAEGIHWREGGWSYWPPHPQISAKSFKNIRIDSTTTLATPLLDPTARPITLKPGGPSSGQVSGIQFGRTGKRVAVSAGSGTVAIADEAINQYDLLELTSEGHVRPSRNGAGSLIVGISCATYSAGELCIYATQSDHYAMKCHNLSGATIPQGALIRPDPANIGCVKKAASLADGPIIGRVNDAAIANNSTGRLMLML